jgi:hypothetical protein
LLLALLVLVVLGALLGAPRPVHPEDPLFAFVQISDSQPNSEADWRDFEEVLDSVAAAGSSGALLPRPIAFVLIAGDLVSRPRRLADWNRFLDTIDERLTANDIPYRAVPGNQDWDGHDGLANYALFIGDPGVWESDVDVVIGRNGRVAYTGWSGLRIIGFNNANEGWNQIDPADVDSLRTRAEVAAAAGQSVYLLGHHPHDEGASIPLADVLETPAVCCYGRGHSGSVGARRPLASIANQSIWDLNTNRIPDMRAILYFEVHPSELHVYTIRLDAEPTELPAPRTIALAGPLVPSPLSAPLRSTFLPDADAQVNSSDPTRNYGSSATLRVRGGDPTYRSYLRFPVSGLAGASVLTARLRLFATDPGPDGGALFPVASEWSEDQINWSNAPALEGAPVAGGMEVVADEWREIDVTAVVQGDGVYTFALDSSSSSSVYYSSREGGESPQLVIASAMPLEEAVAVPSLFTLGAACLLAALLVTGMRAAGALSSSP